MTLSGYFRCAETAFFPESFAHHEFATVIQWHGFTARTFLSEMFMFNEFIICTWC